MGVNVRCENGTPCQISYSKEKEKQFSTKVLWAAGPWRSSGDWWEHDAWLRDEWDIAVPVESGLALYRLVEDRLSRNWFVEGAYD